jgi:hypothetical protein
MQWLLLVEDGLRQRYGRSLYLSFQSNSGEKKEHKDGSLPMEEYQEETGGKALKVFEVIEKIKDQEKEISALEDSADTLRRSSGAEETPAVKLIEKEVDKLRSGLKELNNLDVFVSGEARCG